MMSDSEEDEESEDEEKRDEAASAAARDESPPPPQVSPRSLRSILLYSKFSFRGSPSLICTKVQFTYDHGLAKRTASA